MSRLATKDATNQRDLSLLPKSLDHTGKPNQRRQQGRLAEANIVAQGEWVKLGLTASSPQTAQTLADGLGSKITGKNTGVHDRLREHCHDAREMDVSDSEVGTEAHRVSARLHGTGANRCIPTSSFIQERSPRKARPEARGLDWGSDK